MAYAPIPVKITQAATNPDSVHAPENLLLVGPLPENATPQATTSTYGTVKKAATIANQSTFADLAAATTAYNNLLTALKNAGIMA
jgi:hypothetical protein